MSWKRINNWLWTPFLPRIPKAFCVYSFLAPYAISKVGFYIHICIYIRSDFIVWLRRNNQDKVQLLLCLRPTLPRSSWEPHRQRIGREMRSRKTCLRSSSLWQGAQTSDLHPFLPSTRLHLFLLYVIVMPSNFSTCSGFLPLALSSVPSLTHHWTYTAWSIIYLSASTWRTVCLPAQGMHKYIVFVFCIAFRCYAPDPNCLDMYYPLKILGRKQRFQLSLRLW